MFTYEKTLAGLKAYIGGMDIISPICSKEEATTIINNYFKFGDSGWSTKQFAQESDIRRLSLPDFIEDSVNAVSDNDEWVSL